MRVVPPVVVTRFIEAVTQIKAMGVSLLIAESNLMTASRMADRLYAIPSSPAVLPSRPAMLPLGNNDAGCGKF